MGTIRYNPFNPSMQSKAKTADNSMWYVCLATHWAYRELTPFCVNTPNPSDEQWGSLAQPDEWRRHLPHCYLCQLPTAKTGDIISPLAAQHKAFVKSFLVQQDILRRLMVEIKWQQVHSQACHWRRDECWDRGSHSTCHYILLFIYSSCSLSPQISQTWGGNPPPPTPPLTPSRSCSDKAPYCWERGLWK